jgi:hypothetical protein
MHTNEMIGLDPPQSCVRYFFLVSVSKAAFGLPLFGSFLAAPGSTFLSFVVPGASPLDLPLS